MYIHIYRQIVRQLSYRKIPVFVIASHVSHNFELFNNVCNQISWVDHNFKERSENALAKCLDIMSNHNVKLAGHIQNLQDNVR